MVPSRTTNGRILALITFVLLHLSNITLFAQAPESLAGMTIDFSVTEKSDSRIGCHQDFRYILNDNGDGYMVNIFNCQSNGVGESEIRFTYRSLRKNSSTVLMDWIDSEWWWPWGSESFSEAQPPDNTDLIHSSSDTPNWHQTLTFNTPLSGFFHHKISLLEYNGPHFESGTFKAYKGTAPTSFSYKIATFYISKANELFSAGTYYITTDAENLTFVNESGETIFTTSYLYKIANQSTGMVTLPGNGLITFTFKDASSGNFLFYGIGEGFSADFSLTTIPPPTISFHPQSQSVGVGQSATMSVTANGTGNLTYQWYKDGVALPRGTSSAVNIPSVQVWHGGTYHVVVSNGAGEVTSSSATLTPVCSYSFSPNYTLINYLGGNRQVNVSATGTCPWTASTTNSWIQITSGSSGEGNGTVQFSIAPNDTGEPRNGFLHTLGKTFVVAQRGDLVRTNIAGKTLLLNFESGNDDPPASGAFITNPEGSSFRLVPKTTNLTHATGTYLFSKTSNTQALLNSDWLAATLEFTNATSGTFSGTNHLGNATTGEFVLTQTAPDLNGDAQTDLVFQNTSAVLASWFMEGTSLLHNTLLRDGIPLASNQRAFALADVNNDGQTDIVLRNTQGRLSVWLMNGTERLDAIVLRDGITAPPWRAFSTTDLRGNGNHDILFQHKDGRLAAWHFDQTNFIGGTILRGGAPIGAAWRAVGSGDFNGDGQSDILLQSTAGKIAVGWMNAGDYIGAEIIRTGWTPPAGLRVVGVGDLNGDGRPDILFQNSRQQLAVWIMNGKHFVQAMYLRDAKPVGSHWRAIGPK